MGYIPGTADAAAIFKQPHAQRIAAVLSLGHHIIVPHGGQQAEHRTLGQAGTLGDLSQGQGLPTVGQQLQKLDRLGNRANDMSIGHRNASFLSIIIVFHRRLCQRACS